MKKYIITIILVIVSWAGLFADYTDADVASRLDSVLQQRKYQRYHLPEIKPADKPDEKQEPGPVEKLMNALIKWIKKIFSGLTIKIDENKLPKIGEIIGLAVIVILGATVIFLLLRWLFNRPSFRRRRRTAAARSDVQDRYRFWINESKRLAAAGNFTDAVSALIRALVLYFSIRGILDVHDGDTNLEIAGRIRTDIQKPLMEVVAIGQVKVFGGRDCTAGEYDRCLQITERILRQD